MIVVEITISSALALIGLTLALTELYLPKLSLWLESGLDRTADAVTPVYLGIGGAARQFNAWISDTWLGTYYDEYHWRVSVGVFVPALLVGGLVETGLVGNFFETGPIWILLPFAILLGIPLIVVLVLSIPIALYMYLYPVFFAVCKLFSLPFWGIAKFIQLLNFAGRGQGLSGLGLVLALNDVVGHFV